MALTKVRGSGIDADGQEIILDADGDTTITSDTDDRVDIKVAGTDTVHIDASGIGVNVTNPLYPFHTRAASGGDNAALFLEGPNNGYSTIYIGDTDDIDIGSIQYNHSSDYMLFQTNNAERMRLGSTGSLNVMGVYNDTTTSSANVNVASDGHIRRVVSSRRYKNTINDATHGLKELLTLRSVTYKGNNEEFLVGGLIAEEVHDSGLTEFVEYDNDGKPDSLAYSNMVSLCIKAIQELSAKVETLEAKVTALESK